MPERYTIGMFLLHGGSPRDLEALEELEHALPRGDIGEPDDLGVFEITIEAEDEEDALRWIWDAVASAGADDHIVFLQHPEMPDHWRHLSGSPSG
jgi:hypothetical protein